jgi:hypothetical protein
LVVSPAAQHVEHGSSLGDAQRVVDLERREHARVAETDALGPLRQHGVHHLRGGAVGELRRAVVLHHPPAVVAQAVGELCLGDAIAEHLLLVTRRPRPRSLQFVEHVEDHETPRCPSKLTR